MRAVALIQGPRLWLLRLYLSDGRSQADFGRPELRTLCARPLQNGVRRNLCEKGITVEVSLSSNILIGDLGDIRKPPLWRVNPANQDGETAPLSGVWFHFPL